MQSILPTPKERYALYAAHMSILVIFVLNVKAGALRRPMDRQKEPPEARVAPAAIVVDAGSADAFSPPPKDLTRTR